MTEVRILNIGLTRIAFEERGRKSDPPVVLVHGLGQTLRDWPDSFVEALAAFGLRVITFDNRDIGRSARYDVAGPPPVIRMVLAAELGLSWSPPLAYGIGEMAVDVVGLCDALGIGQAHLIGLSMGGMIAQRLALARPDRVASLCLVMSSSGAPGLRRPEGDAARLMRQSASEDLEQAIGQAIRLRLRVAGELNETDRIELRARVERSIRYGWPNPDGSMRQYTAILGDRSRWRLLGGLRAPTLVMHGVCDPLLPPDHGKDLAARIPDARLQTIDGMGHEIAASRAAELARVIAEHVHQLSCSKRSSL